MSTSNLSEEFVISTFSVVAEMGNIPKLEENISEKVCYLCTNL